MDIYKYLILIKGQDKTEQVKYVKYQGGCCNVTFTNGTYSYARNNLQWINADGCVNCQEKVVLAGDVVLPDAVMIVFFQRLCRVIYRNGYHEIYKKREIKVQDNVLSHKSSKEAFSYFKGIAQEISLTVNGTYNILGEQYSELKSVSHASVLSSFLSERPSVKGYRLPPAVLYPFGLNKSQKVAVENALTSQVSIIQGPPGTGKTQTILNILANIVFANKTVAIVSNNNAAIENVIQKLKKNDLDFITACLGNTANKTRFLESQTGFYPQLQQWMLDQETKGRIAGQISSLTMELNQQMEIREKCAFLEQQLRELEDEQFYFQKYYTDASIRIQNIKPVSADKLLKLWNAFEEMDGGRKITGFWAKLGLCMTYGMWVFKLFRVDPREAVISLQKQYYEAKKEELSGELRTLEELCEKFNFQDKFDQLANNSMMYFKDMIANKYGVSEKRMVFEQTCFHKNSRGFISEYPVILSTTYSIKKCLDKDFIYDYIIVDESSQVDLVTGVLAMSCAKNIVVVGDTRQLPNVITNKEVTVFKKYWREGMAERFNFVTQNLLSSAALTWQCAKSVLLREHYRCSPDIINFCNQKFYNNQLIIMTKEDENNQALKLFKTSEGNHGRGHVNQREIDVIKNEILPEYINSGERDIGIITPYVDQAAAMKAQLPDFCEIDTVHKFQGREKNVIILSSVLNVIDDFVNDPHMINVAVSRAVKSLIVVTSGNKENDKTYYGELARYIEYNNYSIVQSKTYSVFDMLYKEYNQERRKYLARHKRISEWDSENLMYTVIEDVLGNYSDLDCSCHVPLSMIVKDISGLDDRETRYALHPFTHVDFLIFTRIDKTPKLAIEVDGVKFHQEGSTQAERDKRKDHILETIHMPLLRLRTDGSNERQVLDDTLRKIVQGE